MNAQPTQLAHDARVVVVGQGYVGLPLAMRAVEAGFDVIGLEVDQVRVDALNEGRSFVEDISDERLSAAIATGRYTATTDVTGYEGFDLSVITVPTPLREGDPDLTYIEESGAAMAPYIRPGACVVLESTTYPGTTEELLAPILEAGCGLTVGADFHLGYSPERIDPGNKQWTLENTPKVVSGIDAASLAVVQSFYDRIVDSTKAVKGTREAELTKLLENTFRHVNIALVNELAMYAADLGVDVWESIDAATTKPFGYMRFTPGPGVGGHCLPIDPSYLSWRVRNSLGVTFRFVELANDINNHMPDYVIQRVTAGLNARKKPVNGSRIVLMGLTYKPNTGDARESPALRIAELLLDLGADLRVCDPHVTHSLGDRLVMADLTEAELAAADAVVLVTDHDDFDYDLVADTASYVLDTRHRIVGDNVEYL